jgi:hypothetical protein
MSLCEDVGMSGKCCDNCYFCAYEYGDESMTDKEVIERFGKSEQKEMLKIYNFEIGEDNMDRTLKKFTINNRKFKDKYYNSIINGIKSKYKELYPNDKISIIYKTVKNAYTFLVYKQMVVISNSGDIGNNSVLLTQYANIEAINIFSDIDMEEYLEEYDDSRKNYYEQLKEYIDGLVVTYTLLGLNFQTAELKLGSYWISLKSNPERIMMSTSDYISGYMQYDIVTESDFKNAKTHIKNGLEKFLKKYKK